MCIQYVLGQTGEAEAKKKHELKRRVKCQSLRSLHEIARIHFIKDFMSCSLKHMGTKKRAVSCIFRLYRPFRHETKP